MVEVVTVGETMAAVRPLGIAATSRHAELSVAGSEGNVAVGLARLGHAVRFVGAVGDDALGRLVSRTYAAEGIDVSHLRVDAGAPTGILVSEQRLEGVARVDYHRTGSAGSRIRPEDVLAALACRPASFHVSGITPALGHSAEEAVRAGITEARRLGARVCFDVNYRARLWDEATARAALAPLLPSVDVLVADPGELGVVVPEGTDVAAKVRVLLGLGVQEVVVKRGPDGASVYLSGDSAHVPAYRVRAVQVIGAGDAFVAGYLSASLDRLSPRERVARGNALGAFVVSNPGDWEGLPTRRELPLLEEAEGAVVR